MVFDPIKEGGVKVFDPAGEVGAFDPLAEGGVAVDISTEKDPATVDFTVNKSFDVALEEQFNQVEFTDDVMNIPEVEFAPITDPAELVVTEETLLAAEQAESANQIGFKEALVDKAGKPLELLPFVGELYKIDRIGGVIAAAERIQKNPNPPSIGDPFVSLDATPQQLAGAQVDWMRDRYLVAGWLTELEERQTRGVSAGGRIAEGILELPSFMVEFLATSGVYEGAKQATKKTIGRLLQRAGAKVGKEFAEKVSVQTGIRLLTTSAGVLAGTAVRTGAQFTRVLESSFQRQVPGIKLTPAGEVAFSEAQETPLSAIVKGFGSVYIENLTEIAGEGFAKIPFLKRFNDELRDAWLVANPDKVAADFTKSISTKVGYNGFIAELGEEQLATILNAATGVETFGAIQTGDKVEDFIARMIAAIPSGEDLFVQAGILVVPGAIKAGAGAVESRLGGKQAEPAAADETDAKPTDVTPIDAKGLESLTDAQINEIEKTIPDITDEQRGSIKSQRDAAIAASKETEGVQAKQEGAVDLTASDSDYYNALDSLSLEEIQSEYEKRGLQGDTSSIDERIKSPAAKLFEIAIFDGKAEDKKDADQKFFNLTLTEEQQIADFKNTADIINKSRQAQTEEQRGKIKLSQPTPQAEDTGTLDQLAPSEVAVLRDKPAKEQVKAFTDQKSIDRTAEESQVETQNRVAVVKNLSPEAQKQIETESIKAVKERISFKKPKISIRKHFSNLLVKTDKAFRDEFAGLRRAVEAADAGKLAPADDPVQLAVAFTQKSSAKTRGFVMESTTDLAGNRKSKGLKQIFTPIIADGGKKNFEDFVTYLVAARDLNLQKQGKETGINPVASQLTVDALGSPAFEQAAREVTEWNQKGIDLLVESGRITQESGQAIKDANPIYAPFFREFGEEEAVVATGKGKKFKPKRLKGSKRKIIDPIEGMIQQMDATIQSAQRAAIERSLANLAEDNPEALEDFIKPVRTPVKPTQFTADEIKDQLEDIGIDFEGVSEEDLDELITVFRPSSGPTAPGVISLDVDGKKKFFRVQQDLLDVLDGTEVYKLGPFWDIVVGKATRLLKLGATGLNAAFGLIRNPIRDVQTFTVTSEFAKGGPFSALTGILKDVKTKASGIAENFGFDSIKPDSDVGKFAALGGEMSGFITQDRQGTKHIQHEMLASNGVRYTINTFLHPIDALRSLIGITEIGTRIGEFSPALKEGEKLYGKGSLSASVFALNAAQDVTTNFTRHGQIGKQINQIIPFFNAAIQGPDKLVRSFRARPLKSTVAAVSTLTIPAIFFWWRNKDKPWYQNMTAHEKASYVHFESPQDEDVIFRFPVPFELGHVFQAIPVAFLDAVHKERPEEIKEILKATINSANPLDWPSLIGPVIDIKANEDFAGRPIVSRANEGKLAKDQFGPHTTELMKVIGKQINMSPSQIEHLTNSYTGGIYNRVARIFKNNDVEKQPADIPVIGTLFTRDPFAPRKQVEEFYKERELLNKKFQSKDITFDEAFRRVVINNLATVLNVSFDKLKESKTTDERKAIWRDIAEVIKLTETQ